MGRVSRLKTLYLVRHGAIVGGAARSYVGQVERPLSEEGLRQAMRLRVLLQQADISSIYSSDLHRAVQTAETIAEGRGLDLRIHPGLREISLGAWEGRTFSEIQRRYPSEFKARGEDLENWRPPGGESFGDCRDRVLPIIREILNSSRGDVLIVGHAGVNRVSLCDVLGVPVGNLFRIRQDYGCLNIIDHDAGQRHVRLLNYTPWGLPVASGSTRPQPALGLVS